MGLSDSTSVYVIQMDKGIKIKFYIVVCESLCVLKFSNFLIISNKEKTAPKQEGKRKKIPP